MPVTNIHVHEVLRVLEPIWMEKTETGNRLRGRIEKILPSSANLSRPDPVHVERLSIGVTGGIQPDRLKSLLLKSDDDGSLARFLPIFPDLAPIRRPSRIVDDGFIEHAPNRLLSLQMITDDRDVTRPWLVHFPEETRDLLVDFRAQARVAEGESEGLLLSFLGKTPGFVVRLSLLLTYMDWSVSPEIEPHEGLPDNFRRAAYYIENYAIPMAR